MLPLQHQQNSANANDEPVTPEAAAVCRPAPPFVPMVRRIGDSLQKTYNDGGTWERVPEGSCVLQGILAKSPAS